MRTHAAFLAGLGAVFTLGLVVLLVRLFQLQVTDVAEARENVTVQAARRIQTPGPRGRILDREGRVLADCRPNRLLVCDLGAYRAAGRASNIVARAAADLARLAAILGFADVPAPERLARHLRGKSAVPFIAWRDLDERALARFAEHADEFPGFDVFSQAERVYPFGPLAAHVLGYVGRDRPDTSGDDEKRVHYFFPESELRGRSGLELVYNSFLAGAAGEREVFVDARGFRPAGAAAEAGGHAPTDGLDLSITLDARLQAALEKELRGVTGAGVALDPRDGAVLALASAPAFDPNACSPALTAAAFATLTNAPAKRGQNRATAEYYAPGSIFKPITALAALNAGVAPDATHDCCGVYLGIHCWDRYGHGAISLRRALEQSCNSYFCQIGREIGTNALFATARAFGLARRTGIDLDADRPGALANERWVPSCTYSSAIGQGMLQVTPLQMAVVCAALANGGKVYRPYLRLREPGAPPPEPVNVVRARPENFEIVRAGMRDVVEKGTGRRVRTRYGDGNERWILKTTCAGKTGTAEVGRGATRRKNTWVIAFAPYEKPTIALALLVERGESGGLTVAPRVHNVLASVFGETNARQPGEARP